MKIVDIGEVFNNPVASIFKSWQPRIVAPHTLALCATEIPTADLVCFGGGADVSPAIYGHKDMNQNLQGCIAARDRFEREVFEMAIYHRIPMLGICRGAQFLCTMSGGALFQHINRHAIMGVHNIVTHDGLVIPITSTHHQMMYPEGVEHELLAWCWHDQRTFIGGRWDYTKMTPPPEYKEQEVVYFPKTHALCIQGHPEYLTEDSKAQVYTRQLVEQKLFGTRNQLEVA